MLPDSKPWCYWRAAACGSSRGQYHHLILSPGAIGVRQLVEALEASTITEEEGGDILAQHQPH
jgi:hypothetical protein